ncbi:Bug family tripartite tricarboxylate transporter substrate binding protein [Cupriavidus sp. NPDC089707]|uniref:Bug family tripartite tricarboxylate transporter substrate binding protein n=1 Tax=Cupriavidus sp. NPDC089707 TaxID=3363963 RepID=UPI0037FB997B
MQRLAGLASRTLAILAASLALAPPAMAQNYPERLVKIVSPASPGTSVDHYLRLLAQHLGQKLGQPFIVENRPGGNMIIGTDHVAKAAPDGYTLLMASSGAMSANPYLFKKLPYTPLKDFIPIARFMSLPMVIAVPASSPYHTLAELVAAARAQPGKLNFGTAAAPSQVAMAAFNEAAGIRAVSVPYKGMANLLPDVMTGVVDYSVSEAATVLPHVQSGKLRVLAVLGNARVPAIGDAPTMAEAGYPGVRVGSWAGLFAPAGTPPAIVEKLSRYTLEFVNSAASQNFLARQGSLAWPASGPELAQAIRDDQQMWQRLISLAGIEAQ